MEDFPFQIPVKALTSDGPYLDMVRKELPRFLASMPRPRLAIYNAGTDIVAGHPLGRLAVSPDGVAARGQFVVKTLAKQGIAAVIVTSGGYAHDSHKLISQLALALIKPWSERSPGQSGVRFSRGKISKGRSASRDCAAGLARASTAATLSWRITSFDAPLGAKSQNQTAKPSSGQLPSHSPTRSREWSGPEIATVLTGEVFCRRLNNRRQVASYVGLTPSHFHS